MIVRWHATITYRADLGPVEVEHDLSEMSELHALVERGPHWDCVERIVITRVLPHGCAPLTVEEARL